VEFVLFFFALALLLGQQSEISKLKKRVGNLENHPTREAE